MGGSTLFWHTMMNAMLCSVCIELLWIRNAPIQKGMGWRVKEGFAITCAARCSWVRHTPIGGDHNNALVSIGLSLCRGCIDFFWSRNCRSASCDGKYVIVNLWSP